MFLVMTSCYTRTHETIHLEYEILANDLDGKNISLMSYNGKYIIWQDFMMSPNLHIYDLERNEEVSSIISIGQGPNDFIVPFFSDIDSSTISIFDMATYKYAICCNKEDVITNNDISVIENKALANAAKEIEAERFVAIDSNEYVLTGPFATEGLFYHITDDRLEKFGEFPIEGEENGSDSYIGIIAYNKTKQMFVYSAMHIPYIAIYQKEGNTFKHISSVKEPFEYVRNDQDIIIKKEGKGVFGIAFTDEHIITLQKDENDMDFNMQSSTFMMPLTLFVRDYDGQLKYKIDLGAQIFAICGNEGNNELYAIISNPEYSLVKCKLPSL